MPTLQAINPQDAQGRAKELLDGVHLMYHLFGGSSRGASNLAIGYRGFDFDAEYDDGDSTVDADFTLQGPYVGLSISF